MNDFILEHDIGMAKTALALLCSNIQLYYLIQWRVWHDRDKQKAREARQRIVQISRMRNEYSTQPADAQEYKQYLHLNELYRHEQAVVEYILDRHPNLMFMTEQEMAKAVEEAERKTMKHS